MKIALEDFSGGLTDFRENALPTQGEVVENFVIDKDKGLSVRFGSDVFSTVHSTTPSQNRISGLFSFKDQLFLQDKQNIYYYTDTIGYSTLQTTSGTISIPALSAATLTSTNISTAEWNGVKIITDDNYSKPVKLYIDENGSPQLRTAGLPTVTSASSKSVYTVSIATASSAGTSTQGIIYIASSIASSFGVNEFVVVDDNDSTPKTGYISSISTITGAITVVTSIGSSVQVDLTDLTVGQSAYISNFVNTQPTITASYIYAVVYENSFNIEGYTNLDVGAPIFATITGSRNAIDALAPITLQLSCNLSNTTTHYNLSSTSVGIYRTQNNGTVFYKVGTATIGQSVFVDTIPDNILVLQDGLYINGGVEYNDEPPLAKYVVVANDICWYLNVKETVGTVTNTLPFRFRQSIQSDIDSCPTAFYEDVEGEITGGGSVGQYLIVFTKEKVYRVEGRYDELGQGAIIKDVVSDTVGCLNHRSIVSTGNGVYWCGEDAIYFTNGFQVKQIASKPNQGFSILKTYQSLTATDDQRNKIQASYDKKEGRVFWSFQETGETEAKILLVYDETYDSFTKWSGGTTFEVTAHCFLQNYLIRAGRKYLFSHQDDYYFDKVVDTASASSAWIMDYIPFEFRHINFDFGSKDLRKWVTKTTIQSNADTDINISVRAFNDSNSAKQLKEIAFKNQLEWGDPNWVWSDPAGIWNWITVMSKTRRMVAGSLRCRYKQLQILPDRKTIRSDDYSTATVTQYSPTVKQAVLDDNTYRWDEDSKDWYIRFESDNYKVEYLITEIVSETSIKFLDASGLAPTGSVKWEVVGYPKDQRFSLNRIIYTYEMMDDHGGYYVKEREPKGNDDE